MFRAGEKFDRYRIDALLGEGGMGLVYRAYDSRLRRNVALKVLRPEFAHEPGNENLSEPAARLIREGRSAAALNHPNAVHIFDVGEFRGTPFIAMELAVGKQMSEFMDDTNVSMRTRIEWLIAIANGLGAAHKQGLVHRDVKPDNVMVCNDGSVKVLDFGVAKAIKDMPDAVGIHDSFVTRTGVVMGTPLYMAPEQVIGEALDGRSDQFSWGAVAYELLTGGLHPVATNNPRGLPVAFAILQEKPKPLRHVAPQVSKEISAVVMKALSKTPDERYAQMEDISRALEPLLERASNGPLLRVDFSPDDDNSVTRVFAPPPPSAPSSPKIFSRAAGGKVTELPILRAADRRPTGVLSWVALALLVIMAAIVANFIFKYVLVPRLSSTEQVAP